MWIRWRDRLRKDVLVFLLEVEVGYDGVYLGICLGRPRFYLRIRLGRPRISPCASTGRPCSVGGFQPDDALRRILDKVIARRALIGGRTGLAVILERVNCRNVEE